MNTSVKYFAIFFLLFATCLTSCNDSSPGPSRSYHQLDSLPISNIGSVSATFNAEILNSGTEPILEHGFTWGKTRPFIDMQGFQVEKLGSKSGTGKFSATVESAFERNTTYYVRPFIKTETTVVYGNMLSFKAKF